MVTANLRRCFSISIGSLFFISIAFFSFTPKAYSDFRDLPQITVLASSSLTIPLAEIIRLYSREYEISATVSYDSTPQQMLKIEDGSAGDVVITAHPLWMAKLKQQGLIETSTLTNLVKDRLVLVISKKSYLRDHPVLSQNPISQLSFLNDRMIMVMADPNDTALGLYSKQAITNLGALERLKLWEAINPKIIRSANAKNSLYLIAQGNSAGLVYYSDVHQNEEVKVLALIDKALHDPIVYQVAVVVGENMVQARKFKEFLESDIVTDIFGKHGFVVD